MKNNINLMKKLTVLTFFAVIHFTSLYIFFVSFLIFYFFVSFLIFFIFCEFFDFFARVYKLYIQV